MQCTKALARDPQRKYTTEEPVFLGAGLGPHPPSKLMATQCQSSERHPLNHQGRSPVPVQPACQADSRELARTGLTLLEGSEPGGNCSQVVSNPKLESLSLLTHICSREMGLLSTEQQHSCNFLLSRPSWNSHTAQPRGMRRDPQAQHTKGARSCGDATGKEPG